MSFDYKEALRPLQGRMFSVRELYQRLGSICMEHYGELPVNFTAEDYLNLARHRCLVKDVSGGGLLVDLDLPGQDVEATARRWKWVSAAGMVRFGCYFPSTNLSVTSNGQCSKGMPADVVWVDSDG